MDPDIGRLVRKVGAGFLSIVTGLDLVDGETEQIVVSAGARTETWNCTGIRNRSVHLRKRSKDAQERFVWELEIFRKIYCVLASLTAECGSLCREARDAAKCANVARAVFTAPPLKIHGGSTVALPPSLNQV